MTNEPKKVDERATDIVEKLTQDFKAALVPNMEAIHDIAATPVDFILILSAAMVILSSEVVAVVGNKPMTLHRRINLSIEAMRDAAEGIIRANEDKLDDALEKLRNSIPDEPAAA